jgi:hypothetical protein
VEEVVRQVSEQEPVRIPKKVLEELESVRRYTRVNVLDIPTIRHVAMETEKPALVLWIDKHEQEYGQGLLSTQHMYPKTLPPTPLIAFWGIGSAKYC